MNRLPLNNRFSAASWLLICLSCLTLTGCPSGDKTATPDAPNPNPTGSPAANISTKEGRNPPSGAQSNTDLPRPERAGANPIQLLQNPKVKEELKLTDEQITKIKEVESTLLSQVTTASKAVKEKYKAIEALPKDKQDAEKKKLAAEIESGVATLTKESQTKMSSILKPEQEKRAKEILLQKFDFGIVTKDDYTTELKITAEQKKKLNDIVGQLRTKTIAAWEIPDRNDATKRNKTLAENRKRMEAVMKETNQQAKAVLTPEQLKTLETLKGKPASFSLSDLK